MLDVRIKDKYLKKLSGAMSEIRRFSELLSSSMISLQDIQLLYRLSHNFSGSGTTFGFPEISQTAGTLEESLAALLDDFPLNENNKELQAQCLERLHRFEEACRQALTEPPPDAAALLTSSHSAEVNASPGRLLVLTTTPHSDTPLQTQLSETLSEMDVHSLSEPELRPRSEPYRMILLISDLTRDDMMHMRAFLHQFAGSLQHVPLVIVSEDITFTTACNATQLGAMRLFKLEEDPQLADKIRQGWQHAAGRSPCRVMIVDDDDTVARLYAQALRKAGCNTAIATSVPDAYAMLGDRKYDIAVINNEMPEHHGKDLIRLLRQHPDYARLPIIFTSAHASAACAGANSPLPIEAFLTKPIDTGTLIACVHRLRNQTLNFG